jgi:hypothetical protein
MYGAVDGADRDDGEEDEQAEIAPFTACSGWLRIRKFRHDVSPEVCRGTSDAAGAVCRNDDRGVSARRETSARGMARVLAARRIG